MPEFSLFLLENWLLVGIAAIVFFLIGMLIARFIWGRFAQRLNYAVEENLNLASQWSALGSSQRDLFKKLRSRWQADRDQWETRLLETEEMLDARDSRIAQLAAQLEASGKDVPLEIVPDEKLRAELRELKADLESRDAEISRLKSRDDQADSISRILPAVPQVLGEDNQIRIQDLEQDLIDTHDELHRVREDYLKQVELVESLEAKLIEAPASADMDEAQERLEKLELDIATTNSTPVANSAQFSALLVQRSAELLSFREQVRTLRTENRLLQETLRSGGEDSGKTAAELVKARGEIAEKAGEVASLQESLGKRNTEIESLQKRIDDLEFLDRRRTGLQAELNDTHHELYDVRSALRSRIDEVALLEARLEEFDSVEEEAVALAKELKDTRHELSDVRIAYNEKLGEFEQAKAEMEELEAIIEDRGAEVNDLSSEVRQQRDQLRKLREKLAETEGELEGLSEESTTYSATLAGKESFLEEQSQRITELESALAERYTELNEVRARYDDESKAAKHHSSRAEHLEAELARRSAAFDESDIRITSAEQEIDQANAKIAELTELLASSDQSIVVLKEEVHSLSRDKDETIRDLETATRRIEELQQASREREERIIEIEREWQTSNEKAENLQRRVEQLNAEIEEARANREAFNAAIFEMEGTLRESDSRSLALSNQLEARDNDLETLKLSIGELEEQLRMSDSRVAEANAEAESKRAELEAKLEEVIRDKETLEAAKAGLVSGTREEVEKLKADLERQEEQVRQYADQRRQSIEEIERLRGKVAKRGDSIRELQTEVSNVMMQRAARDNEISLLKDKLRAVESEINAVGGLAPGEEVQSLHSNAEVHDLEAAIQNSLKYEHSQGGDGTSLDALEEISSHHSHESEEVPAPAPVTVEPMKNSESAEDDENTIFFEEASIKLTEVSMGRIDEFARTLRRSGRKVSVSVIGFAGPEGSADYNESLSAKRADAVRERLLERGVVQDLISVKGSGQDRRFTNWRARRVELVPVPNAVAETVN